MALRKKLVVSYEMLKVDETFNEATRLIEKFRNKNTIPFDKLIIKFDFQADSFGYYIFDEIKKSCVIYVNPKRCIRQSLILSKGYYKHPDDVSLLNIIIHEFCHFVEHFYDLENEYKSEDFIIKNLNVSEYARVEGEELIELMVMYILNPYLLKIVNEERFVWLKKRFKPVNACTKNNFFKIYKQWEPESKRIIKKKFNLTIIETKQIMKVRR